MVIGMLLPYLAVLYFFSDSQLIADIDFKVALKVSLLAAAMALLGYLDDRFSLRPAVKLAGQILLASAAWWWAEVNFRGVFPAMPVWLDFVVSVFWIVGAVNAFNLIDGMDGLATGLALIATVGVSGSQFFVGKTNMMLSSFAFMGSLLGFLRYNFNPASVFLGDCGSMFIGFVLSVLPLVVRAPDSFLVSVGVPLLAMGVPIFDTALAIFRRTIRHLLGRCGKQDSGNGRIMNADNDHLHHRILRSTGMNQRRAALVFYGLAAGAVSVGLVAMWLKNNAGGLWLMAFTLATVVIFRDMAKIELLDAGTLLNAIAHDNNAASQRLWRRLAVPLYVMIDVIMLFLVLLGCHLMLGVKIDSYLFRVDFIVRLTAIFAFLVAMKIYAMVWSRAVPLNYIQMMLACFFGSSVGSAVLYYVPGEDSVPFVVMTITFSSLSFLALMTVRILRSLARDIFYSLTCSKLKGRKDISRVLVYGAGLRYRAFRRELVRSSAASSRIVVGIIDDDISLSGKYVGDVKVLGTQASLPETVNASNADTLVIACNLSDERRAAVFEAAKGVGVKVTEFCMLEREVSKDMI